MANDTFYKLSTHLPSLKYLIKFPEFNSKAKHIHINMPYS